MDTSYIFYVCLTLFNVVSRKIEGQLTNGTEDYDTYEREVHKNVANVIHVVPARLDSIFREFILDIDATVLENDHYEQTNSKKNLVMNELFDPFKTINGGKYFDDEKKARNILFRSIFRSMLYVDHVGKKMCSADDHNQEKCKTLAALHLLVNYITDKQYSFCAIIEEDEIYYCTIQLNVPHGDQVKPEYILFRDRIITSSNEQSYEIQTLKEGRWATWEDYRQWFIGIDDETTHAFPPFKIDFDFDD